MSVENKISRSTIVDLRTKPEDAAYVNYTPHISRGLYDRTYDSRLDGRTKSVAGYDMVLPFVNGEPVSGQIKKSLRRIKPFRILDVGCGRGEFLLDIKDEWGRRIRPVGVSLHDLTTTDFTSEMDHEILAGSTEGELKKKKIPVVIGDAQRLSSVLKNGGIPSGFDMVVSSFAFIYLNDPLAALKEIYKVLKIGGVGLIDYDPTSYIMSHKEGMILKEYLEGQYGFDFQGGTVFRKRERHLHLPVKYDIDRDQGALTYRIKENSV